MSTTEQERERRRSATRARRDVPAVLHDRHLTVVAANPLALALSPGFAEGVNLVRFTFIDSAMYRHEPCWPTISAQIAGMLRGALDASAEDEIFRGIVGELSARSRSFAEAWASETRAAERGVAHFIGTAAGEMLLHWQDAPVGEDDALLLLRPRSARDQTALARLAAIVDSR